MTEMQHAIPFLGKRFIYDGKESIHLSVRQCEARDSVRKKIESGRYDFLVSACLYCNSQNKTPLSEKDMYGLPCETSICDECRLVYGSKRLSDDALNEFYDAEYRALDRANPSIYVFFRHQQKKGRIIFDFLSKHKKLNPNDGAVVEIGCGSGGILSFFLSKGFSILGCDLGEEYLSFGKEKYSLNLIKADFFSFVSLLEKKRTKVSVVIIEQVLEHFSNIDLFLQTLRKICNPDTLIYVGVPGIKRHVAVNADLLPFLQIPHLVYFELETLNRFFKRNNFSLLSGTEQVQAVYGLGNGGYNAAGQLLTKEGLFGREKEFLRSKIKIFTIIKVKNCLRPLKYYLAARKQLLAFFLKYGVPISRIEVWKKKFVSSHGILNSRDRVVLENVIFADWLLLAPKKILLVGAHKYSYWYGRMLVDLGKHNVTTIDVVDNQYDIENYVQDKIENATRHFGANEKFDIILLNGVINYGINSSQEIVNSFSGLSKILKRTGKLIVGYRENTDFFDDGILEFGFRETSVLHNVDRNHIQTYAPNRHKFSAFMLP